MAKLLGNVRLRFTAADGKPLRGGKLYTYSNNTTNKKKTYPTELDALNNTNPIRNPLILDSAGRTSTPVWLLSDEDYTYKLTDADDNDIYTVNDVSGYSDKGIDNLVDSSDNELVIFQTASGAVNFIKIKNNITGENPRIEFDGDDDDVSGSLKTKGTGSLILSDDSDAVLAQFDTTSASVAEIEVVNSIVGADPSINVIGDDTNTGLDLIAKGTGSVNLKNTDSSSAPSMRFFEASANGTNSITANVPAAIASDFDITLPTAQATNNDYLKSDSSGNLSFEAINTATTTSAGFIEFATLAESIAGSAGDKALVPSNIQISIGPATQTEVNAEGHVYIGPILINWVSINASVLNYPWDEEFPNAFLAAVTGPAEVLVDLTDERVTNVTTADADIVFGTGLSGYVIAIGY